MAAAIPNDNDVLFGRGTKIAAHPGNQRFRAIVQEQKQKLMFLQGNKEIARDIVDRIYELGGRFLISDGSAKSSAGASLFGKVWVCVDREKAVQKVVHRLKEKDRNNNSVTAAAQVETNDDGGSNRPGVQSWQESLPLSMDGSEPKPVQPSSAIIFDTVAGGVTNSRNGMMQSTCGKPLLNSRLLASPVDASGNLGNMGSLPSPQLQMNETAWEAGVSSQQAHDRNPSAVQQNGSLDSVLSNGMQHFVPGAQNANQHNASSIQIQPPRVDEFHPAVMGEKGANDLHSDTNHLGNGAQCTGGRVLLDSRQVASPLYPAGDWSNMPSHQLTTPEDARAADALHRQVQQQSGSLNPTVAKGMQTQIVDAHDAKHYYDETIREVNSLPGDYISTPSPNHLPGGGVEASAPSPSTTPRDPTLSISSESLNSEAFNGALSEKVASGGLARKSSFSFLLEAKHATEGFPMTLDAFVRSRKWSNGIVLMQEGDTDAWVGNPNNALENAVRLAFLLAQLFASCGPGIESELASLSDFVVSVEQHFVGAGHIRGMGSIASPSEGPTWSVLSLDTSPSATGVEVDKRQGSKESPALQTLGKLLYGIFALGESPPPDLLIESKASSPEIALGRASKSPRPTKSTMFSKLIEGGAFSISICRLLADMMDIGSSDTDWPFESLDDVAEDLKQKISHPQIFLHNPAQPVGASPLLFGQTTYGRTAEIALISSIADGMVRRFRQREGGDASSVVQAVLVSGIAGSGKTRIIQTVSETLSSSGWLVVKAKFERGLQYASKRIVSSMFNQLVSYVAEMKESGNHYDVEYSLRVTRSIGESIGYDQLPLLFDFLPSLSLLFDGLTSGSGGEMQPEDAQWRLIFSLSKIIEAILDSDRFIMICCDDLQWADKTTLALIGEVLVTVGGVKHVGSRCLFAGLFRDDEIYDSHPFRMQHAYLQMMTSSINTTQIKISSLSKDDIADMLMMELRLPRRYVKELADIVHKKTSGHAFFVVELLNSLLRESVIAYSPGKCRYDWDQVSIYLIQTGDSVAELISSKISSLPIESQRTLRTLSCFGIQTDLSLLQLLDEFQSGIISASETFVEIGILDRAGPIFMFAHDLILQQVYQNIPLAERQKLHISIGQFLGGRAGIDVPSQVERITRGMDRLQVDEQTFFAGRSSLSSSLVALACDQIDAAGPDAVAENSQRIQFARWNLAAGQQAQRHANYHAAAFYYSKGIAFLGKDHGSLRLELHEGKAIALYALGDFDDAIRCTEKIIQFASFEDALDAQTVLLLSLHQLGQHQECVARGLDTLRRLNFDIPPQPSPEKVMKVIIATDTMTSTFSKAQLIALCKGAVDDSVHRVVKMADVVYGSCFFSSSPFLALVACATIQYSLQNNGIGPGSTGAFAVHAMLKILVANNYVAARYWADMILEMEATHRAVAKSDTLSEPMTDKRKLNVAARYWADMVLEMEATHQRLDNSNTSRVSQSHLFLLIWIDIWFRTPRVLSQKLLTYHDNAMKSGQLHFAMPALRQSCRYSLFGGENLTLLKQTLHDRLKRMAKHNRGFVKTLALECALLAALTGESGNFSPFSGCEADPARKELHFSHGRHVFQVMIEYWRGRYELAEEHSNLAVTILPASKMPMIQLIYHTFFRGLTSFNLHRTLGGEQRLKIGEETVEQFGKWAQNSMEVFENKWLLLKAEYHASIGEHEEALRMYEGSIRTARDRGNIHELALAYELMGDCNAARGCALDATECYGNAFTAYTQWGATAVAKQLSDKHKLAVGSNAVGSTKRKA